MCVCVIKCKARANGNSISPLGAWFKRPKTVFGMEHCTRARERKREAHTLLTFINVIGLVPSTRYCQTNLNRSKARCKWITNARVRVGLGEASVACFGMVCEAVVFLLPHSRRIFSAQKLGDALKWWPRGTPDTAASTRNFVYFSCCLAFTAAVWRHSRFR